MKMLRSQILKFCIIGLVCSGLSLSFAQPAEANKTSRDFAKWLQSVTKKAQAGELEHKLSLLKNSRGNIYQLIREASYIVSENNEGFNLPLERESVKNVYQILLVEWNQFQTGNAMAAVPPVLSVKSFVSFQSPKTFTAGIESFYYSGDVDLFFIQVRDASTIHRTAYQFITVPMSGGIAIGAP